MFDSPQFPYLPLSEVFKRINAGTTVVTPNRRLALALKEKFDREQISRKITAWYSADILPFAALIERIYHDALYARQPSGLPLLLSAAQEQVLWESVIQSSQAGKALLRILQTAQAVREAWQLAHAWQLIHRLGDYNPNEDGKAFLDWIATYRDRTAAGQQTDHARICDLITERYTSLEVKKPSTLICYGFDIFTPQQNAFLKNLTVNGCKVLIAGLATRHQQSPPAVCRMQYLSSRDEIYQAALWARSKIEETDGVARIGIVVPTLANYRSALLRTFSTVMHPDVRFALPGAARPVAPFNISLGLALSSYPLIDAALLSLTLLHQAIEFDRISRWLRSPFLAGADTEMEQRALLDARMRRFAEPTITLERLLALVKQSGGQASCPVLFQCLSALQAFRQTKLPRSGSHSIFARIIAEVLQITGFPGERSLDSTEYQVFQKWQALVAGFAALDHVTADTNYPEAIGRLRRMAGDTLFQPETPSVPIQILGVLEAAGMEFDHLWVMGLSDEQWPLRSDPNPFLPLALQRNAKLPLSSVPEALAHCQRLTQGWLSAAPEIILSYPKFSDDRDGHELKPSPLIQPIAESKPLVLAMPLHRERIMQSCELEQIEDDRALPLDKQVVERGIRGGTSVIKDFAACPFRAWAKHRLHIENLETPHTGLNALERGLLVHQVLAQLWRQLKSKEALDAIGDDDLDHMLIDIAGDAVSTLQQVKPATLSGRFAQIEQHRLIRLARAWLDEEKKRDHFTVIATEEKHSIQVGDLVLSARLDRIDELASGQRIIIDYKTRKQSIQTMLGERPDEPQLPIYLVTMEAQQQTAGVAFAVVKRGDMGFTAVVRDADLLPGVKAFSQVNGYKQYSSWEDLVAAWRQHLTNLAVGFCGGDAQVNPKNFPLTCEYCDMQLFCRIHERMSVRAVAQDNEND
ncbi:MAG: PD-(D/E)XK nuclease family protein [Gammaproteobacteria bacterium]|nr:MAG: PD-(D/E)XK nuclease family protein [Gammaproteobacteria bacterium]